MVFGATGVLTWSVLKRGGTNRLVTGMNVGKGNVRDCHVPEHLRQLLGADSGSLNVDEGGRGHRGDGGRRRVAGTSIFALDDGAGGREGGREVRCRRRGATGPDTATTGLLGGRGRDGHHLGQ